MGDFGEVLLREYHGADVWPAEAIDDNVVHDHEAVRRGLQLFCWLRQQVAARPADEDCGALPPQPMGRLAVNAVVLRLRLAVRSYTPAQRPSIGICARRQSCVCCVFHRRRIPAYLQPSPLPLYLVSACANADGKFEFLLPRIGAVVEDGPPAGSWEEEHDRVRSGVALRTFALCS